MFFIFGTPRSGTTLLAQSLNQHDDVVVPGETDFIIPLAFIFDRIKDATVGKQLMADLIVNTVDFQNSLGEYLDKESVAKVVLDSEYDMSVILNNIYRRIAAVSGKKMAGDKSPNDLLFLRMLIKQGTFKNNNKIIHIVRDIRDVMVSLEKAGWIDDLHLYFPRFWSNSNLYLYSLFRMKTDQYLLVRYEDLVTDYAFTLRSITDFLGVDFQEHMMNSEKRHDRYRGFRHHENLFKPVTGNNIGGYASRFSKSEICDFEAQAHEALLTFGYCSDNREKPVGGAIRKLFKRRILKRLPCPC